MGDHISGVIGKFKYLGRVLEKSEGKWMALYQNLEKPRKLWEHFGKILGRERSDIRATRLLYHMIVQDVLLYGSETSVLNVTMLAFI